jgi:outer membrane protein TolC
VFFLLAAAPFLPAQENQFQGSVPSGTASGTPLSLTLHDAIARGLKNNLGLLSRDTANDQARAQRLKALSALLPQVTGTMGATEQQVNLQTFGLKFNFPTIPGIGAFNIPTIVGPFHYVSAQASATVPVWDYSAHKNLRSATESQQAAALSSQDGRDLVVQAVANAYLLIIADGSRVDSIQAQVKTAQALYDRASDQKTAGTSPAIDVLRAQVELKQQQQRLLAQQNQLAKDKLVLGRIIGLPDGQEYGLGETVPYSPLAAMSPDEAIHLAFSQRPDYQSAQKQVRAAEYSVKAARGEWYPTGTVNGFYGANGTAPDNAHGVFTVTGAVNFNIFNGGRIRSDIDSALATLKQRQDALGDIGGQIGFEIRSALLDVQSAADQVAVAQSNVELASQTLEQARDRFSAGVADTIEVVQAQESVAAANDNLIAAMYGHNVAKVSLARGLGVAEQGVQKFIEVK